MLKIKELPRNLGGVYMIRCSVNDMRYIGQTNNFYRRLREHRSDLRSRTHRNHALQEDYNLFGEENFIVEIIFSGIDNLDDIESKNIAHSRLKNKCYNVFSGGVVGFDVTQEFRDKISRAHKGRQVSEETRRKKSEATRKQWENTEYREKMVTSASRQWTNTDYRNMMRGIHTGTADACGHKLTAEDVKCMRARNSHGESVSALAKEFGVTYSTARAAITGRTWKNI